MSAQKNIESYSYKIIKKYNTFETRKYEASLFTSVRLPINAYEKASSMGFSKLAGYIFGGNSTQEKIAMTSPVSMSLEDSMTMMFLVPKKYNKADLPVPIQKDIIFVDVPEKTVAAISFGGWANSKKIEEYKNKLKTALDREGISYTDKFFFLGYNPPYEVLFRKNEVIVELE